MSCKDYLNWPEPHNSDTTLYMRVTPLNYNLVDATMSVFVTVACGPCTPGCILQIPTREVLIDPARVRILGKFGDALVRVMPEGLDPRSKYRKDYIPRDTMLVRLYPFQNRYNAPSLPPLGPTWDPHQLHKFRAPELLVVSVDNLCDRWDRTVKSVAGDCITF